MLKVWATNLVNKYTVTFDTCARTTTYAPHSFKTRYRSCPTGLVPAVERTYGHVEGHGGRFEHFERDLAVDRRLEQRHHSHGAGVVVHLDVLLEGLGRRAHGQGDS